MSSRRWIDEFWGTRPRARRDSLEVDAPRRRADVVVGDVLVDRQADLLQVVGALRPPAASRADCTAGKSRPISTAMIAITTSSSIKRECTSVPAHHESTPSVPSPRGFRSSPGIAGFPEPDYQKPEPPGKPQAIFMVAGHCHQSGGLNLVGSRGSFEFRVCFVTRVAINLIVA